METIQDILLRKETSPEMWNDIFKIILVTHIYDLFEMLSCNFVAQSLKLFSIALQEISEVSAM